MSLMDTIRKFNENKKEKSSKFKELQEDYRMQKTLEQRQKSNNERELERFMNEKREKMITTQLKKIRKQETKKMWKGNMFAGKSTITKSDRPILKEKNIFLDHKSHIPITKKKALFFK